MGHSPRSPDDTPGCGSGSDSGYLRDHTFYVTTRPEHRTLPLPPDVLSLDDLPALVNEGGFMDENIVHSQKLRVESFN